MASNEKGNPPAPLNPQVVKTLLDLLSTDDDFRSLFEADASAALAQAGYTEPAQISLTESAAASAGSCLQLQAGVGLASKEAILQDRAKLEKALNAIQHFTCPAELCN